MNQNRKTLKSAPCIYRTFTYNTITVTEVRRHGRQKGVTRQWRGTEYTVDLLPKVKIEAVVTSKDANKVVTAIVEAAKTGNIGDGKIFVTVVEEVL